MHRIPTLTVDQRKRADGNTRQSSTVRWLLAGAFTAYALVGLLLLISPENAEVYGPDAYVYSACILGGGTLAALGNLTRSWVGELNGLPLLGFALGAYAVEVAVAMHETPLFAAINAGLLVAPALIMAARWRVALASMRFSRAVGKLHG